VFETAWKDSIPKDVYYLRIKDPAIGFNQEDNSEQNNNNNDTNSKKFKPRFSPTNPYDAFMYCYPNLFLLELKSAKDDRFSFKGSSAMIKEHQIEELTKAAIHKGIIPGFLFNCRKNNQTYFLHINDFNKFTNETDKSSINKQDIIKYGAIEVIGKIKKVKYRWYVGEFITEMQKSIND
jgi:penicillin-binding protein-related factor A (putative recombinase)